MTNPSGKTIFLHGLWRSGSTYLWSKFRALPGTYCYYEPLHQGLAQLTQERIYRNSPTNMPKTHHPQMDQPYFAEFEPLLKRRGVKDYTSDFAYKKFILHPEDTHHRLKRYIEHLNAHAQKRGCVPVFGFNRTVLRQGWCAQNFDALNIYIDRDPRQIWNSYQMKVAQGNYTFYQTWLLILEHNRAHPLLAPLAQHFQTRGLIDKLCLRKPKPYYQSVTWRMSERDQYALVFSFWLLALHQALQHADILLDLERLSEPQYRAHATQQIKERSALDVSFDDAQPPVTNSLAGHADMFDAVERRVLGECSDLALSAKASVKLQALTDRKQQLFNS